MSKGIDIVIAKGGTAIAGLQARTISYAGEAIDISSDDDNGFRGLDDAVGVRSLDISGEGTLVDATFQNLAFGTGAKKLTDISLTLPDGATITGDFLLPTFELTGGTNEDATYSISLQSSGEWTYTAAV
ncbi:phage tail tube protein [Teredinibacter turnerae]|uniref:phage tail tube protein n=1 Tax=Teredinibacter turnerae TaxID=2426 RepID=UPI0030D53F20